MDDSLNMRTIIFGPLPILLVLIWLGMWQVCFFVVALQTSYCAYKVWRRAPTTRPGYHDVGLPVRPPARQPLALDPQDINNCQPAGMSPKRRFHLSSSEGGTIVHQGGRNVGQVQLIQRQPTHQPQYAGLGLMPPVQLRRPDRQTLRVSPRSMMKNTVRINTLSSPRSPQMKDTHRKETSLQDTHSTRSVQSQDTQRRDAILQELSNTSVVPSRETTRRESTPPKVPNSRKRMSDAEEPQRKQRCRTGSAGEGGAQPMDCSDQFRVRPVLKRRPISQSSEDLSSPDGSEVQLVSKRSRMTDDHAPDPKQRSPRQPPVSTPSEQTINGTIIKGARNPIDASYSSSRRWLEAQKHMEEERRRSLCGDSRIQTPVKQQVHVQSKAGNDSMEVETAEKDTTSDGDKSASPDSVKPGTSGDQSDGQDTPDVDVVLDKSLVKRRQTRIPTKSNVDFTQIPEMTYPVKWADYEEDRRADIQRIDQLLEDIERDSDQKGEDKSTPTAPPAQLTVAATSVAAAAPAASTTQTAKVPSVTASGSGILTSSTLPQLNSSQQKKNVSFADAGSSKTPALGEFVKPTVLNFTATSSTTATVNSATTATSAASVSIAPAFKLTSPGFGASTATPAKPPTFGNPPTLGGPQLTTRTIPTPAVQPAGASLNSSGFGTALASTPQSTTATTGGFTAASTATTNLFSSSAAPTALAPPSTTSIGGFTAASPPATQPFSTSGVPSALAPQSTSTTGGFSAVSAAVTNPFSTSGAPTALAPQSTSSIGGFTAASPPATQPFSTSGVHLIAQHKPQPEQSKISFPTSFNFNARPVSADNKISFNAGNAAPSFTSPAQMSTPSFSMPSAVPNPFSPGSGSSGAFTIGSGNTQARPRSMARGDRRRAKP